MQTIYQTTGSKENGTFSLSGNRTGIVTVTGFVEAELSTDLHKMILEALRDSWVDKVYFRKHKGKKSYFKLMLSGEERFIA